MMRTLLPYLLTLCALTSSARATSPQAIRKVALLVGVEQYEKRGFSNLSFAEDDVTALQVKLAEQDFEVTLMLGSAIGNLKATRQNIMQQLEGEFIPTLKNLNKQDIVLVALAGHGRHKAVAAEGLVNEDHFYCPCDAHDADSGTWISISSLIRDIEEQSGSERNLILVDACRDNPSRGRGVDGKGMSLNRDAVAVMFASSYNEQAYEPEELKHGLFTYYVLEALSGAAKNFDNEVTWDSLVDFVKGRVETESVKLKSTNKIAGLQRPNSMGNLRGKSPILAQARAVRKVALYAPLQLLTPQAQARRRERIRRELPELERALAQAAVEAMQRDAHHELYPAFIRGRTDGPTALRFDLSGLAKEGSDDAEILLRFVVELTSLDRAKHAEVISRHHSELQTSLQSSVERERFPTVFFGEFRRFRVIEAFAGEDAIYQSVPELIRPLLALTTVEERQADLKSERLEETDQALIASLRGDYRLAAQLQKNFTHAVYAVVAPALLGQIAEAVRIAESCGAGSGDPALSNGAIVVLCNTLLDDSNTEAAATVLQGQDLREGVKMLAPNQPHPLCAFFCHGSLNGDYVPIAFTAGRLEDERLLKTTLQNSRQQEYPPAAALLQLAYLAGLSFDLK